MLFALLVSACKETQLPDRELPILSIQAAEIQEGNIDITLDIVVNLTGDNPTNVVVDYTTLAGTATADIDYEGAIGELIFRPGETQKTISVIIKGDQITESTETFDFLLMNPVNATFSQADGNRATFSILDDDDGATNNLTIPTEGYETPLVYPGMSLVWSDEFETPTLNPNNWTHEIGNGASGWGNNELQYYKAENTYMALDDYLVIEAKEESEGSFDYTSSRIITKGKQEFQYGRVDIRAALPKGRGLWPALWMLGSNFSTTGWPACGEIDIMEMLGHNNNIVHGTVHFGADPSQHASAGASRITPSGYTFDEAFHVFSLIWEEDHIQILVDDQMYFEVTPDALNGQPWPFNQPFFFIFNVAVGGNWPGSPDASTLFPQYMVVDYVRVFQ
jgi:hypothetical protein